MKTASLVHFYFGESSYLTRLAQETVQLGQALEGYDKTVLLRHDTTVGPFLLSAEAAKKATIQDLPTRENFVKYLDQLGKEGYTVDVYVFAHGSKDHFLTSKGTYGDSNQISGAYLEHHVAPLKLRAVWQCNCYGSTLNPTWRKLGARVTAGARFVNFYPTRFAGFVSRWLAGEAFGKAVKASDTKLVRTPVQLYLPADALARLTDWGGNAGRAMAVLGANAAAKDYFKACWLDEDWMEGKSGRDNMNHSSEMIVEGDPLVTKKTTL